ncbi:MAG: hypothetical protein QM713_00980 [Arachnia sp.]
MHAPQEPAPRPHRSGAGARLPIPRSAEQAPIAAHLLALQQSAGNTALAGALSGSVQRSLLPGALRNDEGTPEQIANAIANDDPGDVKAINDFSRATGQQRIQLVQVLLRQATLMTFDKRAITRIFNSYGDLETLTPEVVSVLSRCRDRGYDLSDLRRYGNLIMEFRSEVRRQALENLGRNVTLIQAEGARLGVTAGAVDKPATPEQVSAVVEQQQLAQQVADAKLLLARTRRIVVARHSLLAPPERTAKAGDPVYFDPGAKPAMIGVDPVIAADVGRREMPWDAVYAQYAGLSEAVASVLNKNPALYALTSLTEEAPDPKAPPGQDAPLNFGQQRITGIEVLSPEAARKKMGDALLEVYNNARLTMGKVMSGEIRPLALDPVVGRFQKGQYGARWASPYVRLATQSAVEDDASSLDRTMDNIGWALMLAGAVIGTAGAAAPILGAILAGANVASAAAGAAIATFNAQNLTRAAESSVSDDTAVVSPAAAGKAELDALMYQFGVITAIAEEGIGVLRGAHAPAGSNLGFVTKMSGVERTTALADALSAMEPGQVALRTGLSPEDMLVMLSSRATKDQKAAEAVKKLRAFVGRFQGAGPLTGPLAKGNRVSEMLRLAKMTFREYWMKAYGLGLRQAGDVSLHAGFGEAELHYIALVEVTPAREVGIYRNARTGEHAVVQGSGNFNDGQVPHMAGLPGAGGDRWLLVEHYHPERNWAVQFPSGGVQSNGTPFGDFAVLLQDYGETHIADVLQGRPSTVITSPVSARIRYRDPTTGSYHVTTYGYNPAQAAIGAFWVRAETENGAMVDYAFRSIADLAGARADYQRHLQGVAANPGSGPIKAVP